MKQKRVLTVKCCIIKGATKYFDIKMTKKCFILPKMGKYLLYVQKIREVRACGAYIKRYDSENMR